MSFRSYRDLPVWQRAVDLAAEVYDLTSAFPREERFGITSQVRRAAVSISSNIAEGSGRGTTPDLRRFLSYARGSTKESESLILVSARLGLITGAQLDHMLVMTEEISKMLSGFRASLAKR